MVNFGSVINLLVAAATALPAMGVLATAPAAQASGCNQWGFSGNFALTGRTEDGYDEAWRISVHDLNGSSGSGPAGLEFRTGDRRRYSGTGAGTINGNRLELTFTWERPDHVWKFWADIVDDAGHTSLTKWDYPGSDPGSYGLWSSTVTCMDNNRIGDIARDKSVADAVTDHPVRVGPGDIALRDRPVPDAIRDHPGILNPDAPPSFDPRATVVSDVDVYDAPGGNGNVTGMLRAGQTVQVLGNCKPQDWCNVAGNVVPGGNGWVWGALRF